MKPNKNLKNISREESKKIMMDILKDISNFCDENSIRYYLAAGTLIGAIRHKGFIPWDDDIDIEIPRADYNRFIKLYREKGKYTICIPFEKNSIYLYAKVYDNKTVKYESGIDYTHFEPLGVDIDIFPIDGQPDEKHYNSFVRDVKIRRFLHLMFYNSISSLKNKISFKSRILRVICHIISKNVFCYLYLKSATKYSFENSTIAGFITPYKGYDLKHRHRKEVYQDRVKVQFEDGLFWAPIGYDEYLRDVYGNYMQLPPIEQQQTHHTNNVFWKDYVENSK